MIFLSLGYSHSFVTCTDLRVSGNTFTCKGFPRNYDKGYLGTSRSGFAYITKDSMCESKQTKDSYSDKHPMAEVKPGGDLILTWPPQNHGKKGSNSNGGSPDVATAHLYWGKEADKEPSSISEWKSNLFGDLDYQNCVDNGPQTESICSGKITIPSDLQQGIYSFAWYWSQNPGSDYSTCFDIKVTSSPRDIEGELIDAKQIALNGNSVIGVGGSTSTSSMSDKKTGFNRFITADASTLAVNMVMVLVNFYFYF